MYNDRIIIGFFKETIFSRLTETQLKWVTSRVSAFEKEGKPKDLFLAFSAVPRFVGKNEPNWEPEELKKADQIRTGFNPEQWTLDQLVRTYLLLHYQVEEDPFYAAIERIFDTADMRELATLYAALPVLPYQKRFLHRAEEGVRTNMTNVFDAIALENPYPFDYFSQNGWNQMVLKAAFMERPIYRIYGIDERSNDELSRIISDYAHERWAAGRSVSPELWRPVGNCINEELKADIDRLLQSEDPKEQQAAALVCANSEHDELLEKLKEHQKLKKQVENGSISWHKIGKTIWEKE